MSLTAHCDELDSEEEELLRRSAEIWSPVIRKLGAEWCNHITDTISLWYVERIWAKELYVSEFLVKQFW